MSLPPQVQAALDAADATLAAANAQAEAQTMEDASADAPPPDPEPQSPPPVEVEAPPPPKEDPFEVKYRILQGKYNAEVPELHKRVHNLETNLRDAINRLDAASKAKDVAPAPSPTKVVDPKDVAEFGDDLTNMVSRVSEAVAGQRANALEAKLAATEAQLAKLTEQLTGTTQTVAATAEQGFFDKLAKLVPDWEKINADPAFLAWVADSDPVYGVPRQDALNMAQRRLDASRAAAVFTAFAGPRQTAPTANPLAQMVSPKGAATAVPVSTEKPMVTQAQVVKFYDDLRRGAYRGNEAEATRLESLINAALSEGRIR